MAGNATDDLDDDVTRLDYCSAPGCRRICRGIFCAKHRHELATLGNPPARNEHDDGPEAA